MGEIFSSLVEGVVLQTVVVWQTPTLMVGYSSLYITEGLGINYQLLFITPQFN